MNSLANLIVVIHFFWIIFMLVGFFLTLWGFRHPKFFDRWLLRTLHLCGILYVGLLAVLREYCPLTFLEYGLRRQATPGLEAPGSFIIRYLEKLVYPDVPPLLILIPTILIAVFTAVVFFLKPPARVKKMFRRR